MQSKLEEINSWVVNESVNQGSYDNFTDESYERLFEKTVDCATLPAGARILDVGCACGMLGVRLARRGYSVTGCDISPELVEIAKLEAKRAGVDVQHDVADAESLPYQDGSFDLVYCVDMLHHFEKLDKVVAELARVVKSDGVIATVDPSIINPHNMLCQSKWSPIRYDKLTSNERALGRRELVVAFERHGLRASIDYLFLTLKRKGRFKGNRLIYKLYGFIMNSYRSVFKRTLAIILFNIAHAITPLLPRRMRCNEIVCLARR